MGVKLFQQAKPVCDQLSEVEHEKFIITGKLKKKEFSLYWLTV